MKTYKDILTLLNLPLFIYTFIDVFIFVQYDRASEVASLTIYSNFLQTSLTKIWISFIKYLDKNNPSTLNPFSSGFTQKIVDFEVTAPIEYDLGRCPFHKIKTFSGYLKPPVDFCLTWFYKLLWERRLKSSCLKYNS